jgi:hypothetical protein
LRFRRGEKHHANDDRHGHRHDCNQGHWLPPRLMMAVWRNSIKKPAYRQNRPYREFRTLPDPAPCPGYAKYIFANGQQERSVKRERKEISGKGQYLSKAIPFSPG